MSKRYNIQNLEQLHQKVVELKADCKLKEANLVQDLQAFSNGFTPAAIIKRFITPSNLLKTDDALNITGNIMSVVLPLLMNKTLFRSSNFATKLLVSLASGKFGKTLDAEQIGGIINSVKSWFGSSKKKKDIVFTDYGIPPDSETY